MKQKDLNKKIFRALEGDYVKVERRIHSGYMEVEKWKANSKSISKASRDFLRHWVGGYQYTYSSPKGKISLIRLLNYLGKGTHLWEIYCLEGDLFKDVERFPSKKRAEMKIRKLLN